jgi:hypothetical protein
MSDEQEVIMELREALKEAMDAVRTFHGKPAWEIYENRAPEWQRWLRVLEKSLRFTG